MKRIYAILALVMVMATLALGASKERYILLWPQSSTERTDSTYTHMGNNPADWYDLTVNPIASKIRFTAFLLPFAGDTAIDTVHFITRFSPDAKNPIVADSQKVAAPAASTYYYKTHTFQASDTGATSFGRYVQIYAKIAVIDFFDVKRPIPLGIDFLKYDGLGRALEPHARTKIDAWINE